MRLAIEELYVLSYWDYETSMWMPYLLDEEELPVFRTLQEVNDFIDRCRKGAYYSDEFEDILLGAVLYTPTLLREIGNSNA